MMSVTWSESIAPDGTVKTGRLRKVKSSPRKPPPKKKALRLPEGASWVRSRNSSSTYLMYYGLRWGFVCRYRATLKGKTQRWFFENTLGILEGSRTKTGAQRRLVRSLRNELKTVQTMTAPKSPTKEPRRYRKLSHKDILRCGDQYKSTSGRWRPTNAVGTHPYKISSIEYRRPIKDVR